MQEKKFFWVDASFEESWEKRKDIVTLALESGASGVVVRRDDVEKVKALGKIDAVADYCQNADIALVGRDSEGDGKKELKGVADSKDVKILKKIKAPKKAGYVEIASKEHERLAAEEAKIADYIVVVGKDWHVIPLENLIAELHKGKVRILAGVKTLEEAKLVLETLEIGSHGVLIQSGDANEIKKIAELVRKQRETIQLKPAKITKLKQIGMGDRVCIDTASMLNVGEGMLIGSSSSGFFLVHSESLETEYVASRPFRVNAGAVHAYVLAPRKKTKYLSELKAGDEVLAVDKEGNTRTVVVGRAKIEKRPLILIEAEVNGKKFTMLLQNAETIMLISKEGKPVSISKLKEGDEVLTHVKEVARHFGMEVEESIIEK